MTYLEPLLSTLLDDLADRIAARLTPTKEKDLPLFWTVKQAQERTNLSRDTLYELVANGSIQAVREHPENPRSRILITPESVLAWRERQVALQANKKPTATELVGS